MERNFAIVTILTLLFAVSAARIHRQLDCMLDFLPTDQTMKHESNEPENTDEANKDRVIKVDLTPRSDFARLHAINRRFFDESRRLAHARHHGHFQNPFVVPRSSNLHKEGFRASSNKFRRDQHHRHHHLHQHKHHVHKDNNDGSMLKRKHEAPFMKSIRKFLKHTFE